MSLDKTRRGRLAGAALFSAMGLLAALISRHAQIPHTVIPYKWSWFTPEVGYFVALCFFVIAVFLALSAFRRSHEPPSELSGPAELTEPVTSSVQAPAMPPTLPDKAELEREQLYLGVQKAKIELRKLEQDAKPEAWWLRLVKNVVALGGIVTI